MSLIADGLLIATALTAGLYCHVLARRLRRLGNMDEGLGARIGGLDAALTETRAALAETQSRIEQIKSGAASASERLKRDIARAKRISEELEEAAQAADGKLRRLFEVKDVAGLSGEGIEVVSTGKLDMSIAISDELADQGPELTKTRDTEEGRAERLRDLPAETGLNGAAARFPKIRRIGL